jgi:hypothetical protein
MSPFLKKEIKDSYKEWALAKDTSEKNKEL